MVNIEGITAHLDSLEIEESMEFLAIVLVIGGIFAFAWRSEERIWAGDARPICPVSSGIAGSGSVSDGEMESSGYEWLDIIGLIICS